MARLWEHHERFDWPAELATFDPRRWSSRAAWHLERAGAAPSKLIALQEIRASLGKGSSDGSSVLFVEPPAARA
jgi:hypothetical protein